MDWLRLFKSNIPFPSMPVPGINNDQTLHYNFLELKELSFGLTGAGVEAPKLFIPIKDMQKDFITSQ